MKTPELPVVKIKLDGSHTVVEIDGKPLGGLRDIRVSQGMEFGPIVIVEFLAARVEGITE